LGAGGNRDGQVEQALAEAMDRVATLDEDRILRRFLNAVRCSLRTNYWHDKEWISFKIDSRRDRRTARAAAAGRDLRLQPAHGGHPPARRSRGARRHPLVRPARGLPHRDPRPDEDQVVKNAVIVPTGSKGGFYVKRPPANGTREQVQAEGVYCYQTLIRGLLDITDNYVDGTVVRRPTACATTRTIPISWSRPTRAPPPSPTSPMRWPATTASGSTTPSPRRLGRLRPQEDGHHRARRLGIGEAAFPRAWLDIQRTPFGVSALATCRATCSATACCSPQIRLLAAFDHRHIFIDPAPDPARRGPSASVCSTCRARPGWTTTRA
jgi:glutamate dehydrogenase